MIKVKYRVKSHQDFQKIIHLRKMQKSQQFIVYFQQNSFGHARFGISVSKKRGNAVRRNLIKRQVRHMVADIVDYKVPLDVVIIIREGYDHQQFEINKASLEKLWQNMRRMSNEEDEKMA